jgi:hypothetical protein
VADHRAGHSAGHRGNGPLAGGTGRAGARPLFGHLARGAGQTSRLIHAPCGFNFSQMPSQKTSSVGKHAHTGGVQELSSSTGDARRIDHVVVPGTVNIAGATASPAVPWICSPNMTWETTRALSNASPLTLSRVRWYIFFNLPVHDSSSVTFFPLALAFFDVVGEMRMRASAQHENASVSTASSQADH